MDAALEGFAMGILTLILVGLVIVAIAAIIIALNR